MLLPIDQISELALDALLDDFCTREGVDQTHSSSLASRKAQLLRELQNENAFITFNYDYMQACLVSRNDVDQAALKAHRESKIY